MPLRKYMLLLCIGMVCTACASSGVKKLPHNVGNRAFDFTLPDQKGDNVSLSGLLAGYRGAVIAFYPKDDSRN